MFATLGSLLSPGLVSYQVVTFVAPCQPASERFPSIAIGPAARVMAIGTAGSTVCPRRAADARRRAKKRGGPVLERRDTDCLDGATPKRFGAIATRYDFLRWGLT